MKIHILQVFSLLILCPLLSNAQSNTKYGTNAGTQITTGTDNTTIGENAGYTLTGGSQNTLIGKQAGASVQSTLTKTTLIGSYAGTLMQGYNNTAVGASSGYNQSLGVNSSYFGANAGFSITTGSFNTFLGGNTGRNINSDNTASNSPTPTNINNSTFVGYGASANVDNLINATAIGYRAIVSASNALVLGNSANVGIGTSAPTAKLEIASGTSGTAGLKFTNLTSGSTAVASNGKTLTVDGSGNVILSTSTSLSYTAGTGIAISGTSITANNTTALWNANTLQGRAIAPTVPTSGQVLQWNGTSWTPTALPATPSYTAGTGIAISGTSITANNTTALWNANTLQGRSIATTVPTSGQVLQWNGTSWTPTTLSSNNVNYWTLNSTNNTIANNNVAGVILGTGITTTPTGYKLYVSDGILTEKLTIAPKNTTTWADFVFDKNYNLRSLNAVEKYIKQNHHLPDVPSTEDVRTKGLNVVENEAKLLQKIEELTLYLIAQDKKIKSLERKVSQMKRK